MKILFYCPSKFNLNKKTTVSLGGVETLNLHLSKALAKLGYNVYLCTKCKKISKRQKLVNIPISRIINGSKNLFFDYIISSNESKIFNKFKLSKKIFWMHNTLSLEKAFRKGKLISLLKNEINTVFVSKYLEQITSKSYLFNKRFIIPNFLSSEFEINKINYNRKKIVVWSVQRQKGLNETLNMWIESIYPKNKDAKFYIFGVDKSKFKKFETFYKKRNIFFFGKVSKVKLRNVYSNSSAMICLGYDETFCLNAIEANSCGLPVFTFGKTALSELIYNKKNGLIVDNFQKMSQAINHYLISSSINKKAYIDNSYKSSKKFQLNRIIIYWKKLLK
jgi:glycosyltransferase involved in cell wall biosynthesis